MFKCTFYYEIRQTPERLIYFLGVRELSAYFRGLFWSVTHLFESSCCIFFTAFPIMAQQLTIVVLLFLNLLLYQIGIMTSLQSNFFLAIIHAVFSVYVLFINNFIHVHQNCIILYQQFLNLNTFFSAESTQNPLPNKVDRNVIY